MSAILLVLATDLVSSTTFFLPIVAMDLCNYIMNPDTVINVRVIMQGVCYFVSDFNQSRNTSTDMSKTP